MENDSVSRVYCAHVTVMLHVRHSHMIGHMTMCMHNLWFSVPTLWQLWDLDETPPTIFTNASRNQHAMGHRT